jgi:hypothetical protein
LKKKFVLILVSAICISLAAIAPADAALPKKGDIAVVAVPMNGESRDYVDIVENAVIEKLTSSGYKVVDEARKKKIRAAVAQRKADAAYLNGDVDALMKISFGYSVGATIAVSFRVDRPVVNEFKLYTGTASLTFNSKTSGGDFSLASSAPITAKQVGYSEDEAKTKAISAAAAKAAESLLK